MHYDVDKVEGLADDLVTILDEALLDLTLSSCIEIVAVCSSGVDVFDDECMNPRIDAEGPKQRDFRDDECFDESVDGVFGHVQVLVGLALGFNLRPLRFGIDVCRLRAVCRAEGRLLGLLLVPVPASLLAVELVRDGCHGGGPGRQEAVEELRDLLPCLFTWRHYPLTGIKGHSTRPPCFTLNLPENKVPLQLDNNDTYFLPFSFSAANPANHLAEDSGSADDDLEEDIWNKFLKGD